MKLKYYKPSHKQVQKHGCHIHFHGFQFDSHCFIFPQFLCSRLSLVVKFIHCLSSHTCSSFIIGSFCKYCPFVQFSHCLVVIFSHCSHCHFKKNKVHAEFQICFAYLVFILSQNLTRGDFYIISGECQARFSYSYI